MSLRAALLCVCVSAWAANGQSQVPVGEHLYEREGVDLRVRGYLRLRTGMYNNLDLDRGLTPSGQALYPVLDDRSEQTLWTLNARGRLDLSLFVLGRFALKTRTDLVDNARFGTAPVASHDGSPTTERRFDAPYLRLKWAYFEAQLPIGVLQVGRAGLHWGLGMLINDGSCLDCDGGAVNDRVSFSTSVLGHLWTLSFGVTGGASLDDARDDRWLAPPDTDVRNLTLAILRLNSDATRRRLRSAGYHSIEYGAFVTLQARESERVPAPSGFRRVPRDQRALIADAWARIGLGDLRLEGEIAFITGINRQASNTPGLFLERSVRFTQWGFALQSEYRFDDGRFSIGVDAGFASGDRTPGFGSHLQFDRLTARPGDIDGPQVGAGDSRIDNFRFHSDYRIDRILFREIIGTITDAAYARPHVRARILSGEGYSLDSSLFAVASFAVRPQSTPGAASPLGVELDPTVTLRTDHVEAALDYAVLFPLAGLDNPAANLSAKPAHQLRLRITLLL